MKKREFLKQGYEIVVFDCDSTLTKIEGIDLLAKCLGRAKKVKTLTNQAMSGTMRFEDIFSARLNLIKPEKKNLEWLAGQYITNQVPDAKKTIQTLQLLGKKVYIITGGYEIAVRKFANYLEIPQENVFSVELKFGKNGEYLGYNSKNPLVRNNGKKKILEKLSQKGSTMLVGDGATDLEARRAVDLFVGFGGVVARPIVQKEADIFINCKSLIPIVALAQGIKEK